MVIFSCFGCFSEQTSTMLPTLRLKTGLLEGKRKVGGGRCRVKSAALDKMTSQPSDCAPARDIGAWPSWAPDAAKEALCLSKSK